MSYRPLLLVLFGIAYPLCGVAEIYKCTTDASVTYQDAPCKAGQTSETVVNAPIRMVEPNSASPSVFKSETTPQAAAQQSGLALGMTDTEVLNARGWGKPSKIARNKGNKAWREQWTYAPNAEGQRQLEFTNGKLTAINVEPADTQVVQITVQ